MSKIVALSEAASIGLHAVILIAQSNEPVNVLHIAERTQSSKHHVAKVLQRLVKENFLISHRGPAGGFELKKKAKSINFLQIYEALEGKLEISACPLDKPVCPFDRCLMNNVTNKMTEDFINHLKKQTIDLYI